MAVEGQVQKKGKKRRVFLNGAWVEVDKIQANPATGERRALIGDEVVALPAKPVPEPKAPVAAPERAVSQASAFESARGSLLNPKVQEQIQQEEADKAYGIRTGFPQDVSDVMEEYVPTGIGTSAGQAFFQEEDYAALIKNKYPGAELFRDQEGNTIVQFKNGEQKRINAKGFSMGDVMEVGGDVGGMFGLGRLLKGMPGVVGSTATRLAPTVRGQAAAATAYSAGTDVAGNIAAGEEGIGLLPDISRSLTEGTFAGVGQKVLGDIVVPKVSQKIRSLSNQREARKAVADTPAGQLADAARIAMKKADIPTVGLSVEEINRINNALMDYPNLSGAQLGRAISVKGVADIDPSVGVVSQDPAHLFAENRLRTSEGTPETRAAVTERTITQPDEFINRTVDDLNQPQPLAEAQDVLARQRQAEMEAFTGTQPAEGGEVVGGRFKEARAQTGEYELLPEQNQAIRDNIFENVRAAEDYQVATELAGHKPIIEAPEMGALPNPPKPRKAPKGRKPPKKKLPPKSLQVKGKEKQLAEWKAIEDRQHQLKMNEFTDERAIMLREFEAEEAARMAEYDSEVLSMTKAHEDAVARFEAEPPVPERTGGRAFAADTGADKNITPADWLNWAERMSADKTQVGGQVAARQVRQTLSDMAEDEALNGVEGGVLDYLQVHGEYRDMIKKWHPDRLIGKITQRTDYGEGLAVSPERAADVLFGGRKGGFLSKNGAVEAVDDLRNRLTPEQWLPVRKELEFRLIGGGAGKKAGTQAYSPEVMEKKFSEAIATHGEDFIMSVLDDGTGNGAAQLANYKRFFKIGRDLKTPPGRQSNVASDTSASMLNKLANSTGRGPIGTNTILNALRTAGRGVADVAERQTEKRAAASMMNPNAFYAPPANPVSLGILSQLRGDPQQDYMWNKE
jgi:hypothetical protein